MTAKYERHYLTSTRTVFHLLFINHGFLTVRIRYEFVTLNSYTLSTLEELIINFYCFIIILKWQCKVYIIVKIVKLKDESI